VAVETDARTTFIIELEAATRLACFRAHASNARYHRLVSIACAAFRKSVKSRRARQQQV